MCLNSMSTEQNKEIKGGGGGSSVGRAMTLMSYIVMYFWQCTTEISKSGPTAESDVPVQEKPVQNNPVKENIYMSMKSL